ncbi:MAG TPA: 30S ribosome-binding factor RbfA [Candidatus Polarisedimenticolia bacterium]|nr:30S ribosome-binding factor RbfA [Candidatus Polarisedimenticolia bacterium]
MSTRTDRVSDQFKDAIARLLLREVRDPRIGFVTITGVSVSPDLKNVRVFVSVLGDDKAREDSLKALNSASRFMRRNLFRTLRLKHAPEITFEFDDSLDRGERIERALRQIHDEEQTRLEEGGARSEEEE